MVKILEIQVLTEYVDWSITPLPAGIYLDTNNNIVQYDGGNVYPMSYALSTRAILSLKDVPQVAKNGVSIEDVLNIIIASRANPDNLDIVKLKQ